MKKIYLAFALILVFLLNMSLVIAQENITESQALETLLQAEKDIEEMIKADFGTAYVNDTLLEAKKAFEGRNYTTLLEEAQKINDTTERQRAVEMILEVQKTLGKKVDYELVLEKAQIIAQRKQQAYNLSDSIRALNLSITELDNLELDTTETWSIYNSVQIAFENERFEETEELIAEAHTNVNEIRAQSTLVGVMIKSAGENIINYVKENWLYISIVGAISAAVGYIIFRRIMIIRTRNKLRDLKIEKKVLLQLMKKAQTERYKERKITKDTYEIKMGKYKERMMEIKRTIPVLRARLKGKRLKEKKIKKKTKVKRKWWS